METIRNCVFSLLAYAIFIAALIVMVIPIVIFAMGYGLYLVFLIVKITRDRNND